MRRRGVPGSFGRFVLFAVIVISVLNIVGNYILYEKYVKGIREITAPVTGHQTSTAEITFVVEGGSAEEEEPSPAPSGGGGGGGGSGRGASSTQKKIELFDVFPEEFNIFLKSGESDTRVIKVANTGDFELVIDIEIKGVEKIVGLSTNQLIMEPGSERSLIMSINKPSNGVHAGKIVFKSGNIEREMFLIINVVSDKSLIDVSLTVPESSRFVFSGEDLRAFISLVQIGLAESVDAVLHYIVKDFEGNLLFSAEEEINIVGSENFVKDFSTFDLSPGDYVIGVEVEYDEGFGASSARFAVEEEKVQFNFWLIILLILLILAVIVIYYSVRRYKKLKKKFKRR